MKEDLEIADNFVSRGNQEKAFTHFTLFKKLVGEICVGICVLANLILYGDADVYILLKHLKACPGKHLSFFEGEINTFKYLKLSKAFPYIFYFK